jgi:hypothetical protein
MWDGTGSPGDGDPTVDTLVGPEGQRAFAFGTPSDAGLQPFVTRFRKASAKVHPCPVKPERTERTTVGGEPAIVDEMHCPASGGPFVTTAFMLHARHAYVVFTYTVITGPEAEAFTRSWFASLLEDISFNA